MGLPSGGKPLDLFNGAMLGLAQGVVNIGLNLVGQVLSMPQLLVSLGAVTIAGALEGMLEGRNPLEGIFDTYFSAGKGLVTLGSLDPLTGEISNNPCLQAAYIAQVLDFSQIIQDRGIVEALETYATAYLQQTTINEIWKLGGIYDLLMNSNQIEIKDNGKGELIKRIYTKEIASEADKETSNYIDLSLNDDRIMGRREGNVTEHCDYGLGPDRKPALKNGEREIDLGDRITRIDHVSNYKLTSIKYYEDETFVGYYIPLERTSGVIPNADGKTINTGKYANLKKGYTVWIDNNEIVKAEVEFGTRFTLTDVSEASIYGISEDQLRNVKLVYEKENGYVPELCFKDQSGALITIEPYESPAQKVQQFADNIESFYRKKFGLVEWDNARIYLKERSDSGYLKYEIPPYLKAPTYDGEPSISMNYNNDQLYLTNIFQTPDGYFTRRTFYVIKLNEVFVTVANGFLNKLGGYVSEGLPPEDIVDRLGNRYSDVSRADMLSAVTGLCDAITGGINAYNTKFGFYQIHFQRKGDFTVSSTDQWRYYMTGKAIVGYDGENFIYGDVACDENVASNILSVGDGD